MPELEINSAVASNLQNVQEDFSVPTQTTDGVGAGKETEWQNTKASQYLGYYKKIPEARSVIDAKASFTLGKGLKASPQIMFILEKIKGFGKDTFNTILENLARNKEMYGDAFAEIVRDDDGNLTNLKVLDPEVIKIVLDEGGVIKRYEQMSKTNKKVLQKFEPEEIFHLARNRTADEMHGISLLETLEWIILAKNEVQGMFKTVMQRHIKPLMIFHIDEDNPEKVEEFKKTMDKAYADSENLYIPKDVVVPEVLATAPNATLNPMPWLEFLNNQFYQTAGIPQIILGGSGEFTEASAKIAYLAFQQNIEEEQLFIEEQVGIQLGMEIHLTFPASIENELLSDTKKDGPQNIDASETTAGAGQ